MDRAPEFAHSIAGVSGRMYPRHWGAPYAADCFASQTWISESRSVKGYGAGARLNVHVRFDDSCRNGRNSFAVTGDIRGPRGADLAGGCLHDDIAATFPELAHLIAWHLFDTSGPMHYIANTVYTAGDRDHWGKRAGEVLRSETRIEFGDNPIQHKLPAKFVKFLQESDTFAFEVVRLDYDKRPGDFAKFDPKYTLGGFGTKWHEGPFDTESDALNFVAALQNCAPRFVSVPTSFSEGKPRDLDAARRIAVWPDATDAELSADKATLTAALEARLPALIDAMRRDVTAAGLAWSPADIATDSEA